MKLLVYGRSKKRKAGRARNTPDIVNRFLCHTLKPSQEQIDSKYHFSGFRKQMCGNMAEKTGSAHWRGRELFSSWTKWSVLLDALEWTSRVKGFKCLKRENCFYCLPWKVWILHASLGPRHSLSGLHLWEFQAWNVTYTSIIVLSTLQVRK